MDSTNLDTSVENDHLYLKLIIFIIQIKFYKSKDEEDKILTVNPYQEWRVYPSTFKIGKMSGSNLFDGLKGRIIKFAKCVGKISFDINIVG